MLIRSIKGAQEVLKRSKSLSSLLKQHLLPTLGIPFYWLYQTKEGCSRTYLEFMVLSMDVFYCSFYCNSTFHL